MEDITDWDVSGRYQKEFISRTPSERAQDIQVLKNKLVQLLKKFDNLFNLFQDERSLSQAYLDKAGELMYL